MVVLRDEDRPDPHPGHHSRPNHLARVPDVLIRTAKNNRSLVPWAMGARSDRQNWVLIENFTMRGGPCAIKPEPVDAKYHLSVTFSAESRNVVTLPRSPQR
jgi:hypothetical protein